MLVIRLLMYNSSQAFGDDNMTDHNKAVFKAIELKRTELMKERTSSLDGKDKYMELLKLYALIDVGSELVDTQ